jgi:hypothetical protein
MQTNGKKGGETTTTTIQQQRKTQLLANKHVILARARVINVWRPQEANRKAILQATTMKFSHHRDADNDDDD